ncbi:MAG: hypothetical protein OXS33_00905, partial [bacterium]|nr:hypothetical protein [bacterium]
EVGNFSDREWGLSVIANKLAEPDPTPEALLRIAEAHPDIGTLTEETLMGLFSQEGPSPHQ